MRHITGTYALIGCAALVLSVACDDGASEPEPGTDAGSVRDAGDGTGSVPAEGPMCDEVGAFATMESDPDSGFVDISDFCLAEINSYRAMEGLEPFTLRQDRQCCSALEARQAVRDDTAHNGDFCDWAAQGACGGGRGERGTVEASVAWCPRLFYREGPEGGHYRAMMRPEPREIQCGYYARDRDKHSILVNYW